MDTPDPKMLEMIQQAQSVAEAGAVHQQIVDAQSSTDILAAHQSGMDSQKKKPWYARTEFWLGLLFAVGPNLVAGIMSPPVLVGTLPATILLGASYIYQNIGLTKEQASGMTEITKATIAAIAASKGKK